MKKAIVFLLLIFVLIGCAQQTEMPEEMGMDEMEQTEMPEEMGMDEMEQRAMQEMNTIEDMEDVMMADDWRNVEINDVVSGEMFKISDFTGEKVFIESFAVWCPTCRKQQDKIKELHAELGDAIVSISLNTDPNEDSAKVLGHVNRYNYDWRFAVAPVEMTKSLIAEFGINIVNAPGAPVVLVCEDQSARLLGRGLKDKDELKMEIEKGC